MKVVRLVSEAECEAAAGPAQEVTPVAHATTATTTAMTPRAQAWDRAETGPTTARAPANSNRAEVEDDTGDEGDIDASDESDVDTGEDDADADEVDADTVDAMNDARRSEMREAAPNDPDRPPPMQDPVWRAAFMAELPMVLDKARNQARRLARSVELRGGRGDSAFVDDLVQDVLTDTMLGALTWDPTKANGKLWPHVRLAIQSRARDARERAEARPHLPLDAGDSELVASVEEALAAAQPPSNAEAVLSVTQLVARLRTIFAGDPEVVVLLDAMLRGYLRPEMLMRVTGMTPAAYKAARKRLTRGLDALPQDVGTCARVLSGIGIGR